jgi:dihydrofolate reductase
MTRTQYFTASSLDGFIADRGHSLEWLLRLGEVEDTSYPAFIAGVGALAMGANTYRWLLDHQRREDPEAPLRWPYDLPSWVFSSRGVPPIPGADIRYVDGDVGPVHRDMVEAAEGKNLWIVGGGELAGQFHDHGLLDEIIVQIASVTLGGGAPLLPREIVDPPLKLISATTVGTAFAELRYEVVRR